VWSEQAAQYSYTLIPHFDQTYWFYALCALALALIVWELYRLRVRRMETQFSAVLAERNRLAREIHDTLAQGFAGISVQLELVARVLSVSTEKAQTHLDQARILVRNSLAEARRSVWDLRSQALESGSLPTALAETARQLTSGTPIQAQVQVNGAYRELPTQIENNLLRIGQEAITNAVKHSGAQHLRIELKFAARRVRLSVRDDGRGFSDGQTKPSATGGHFGLVGMRERAAQISGKLSVESAPGEGTEISVDVPVND
jgi:signal transduction histidine kinase